MRLNTTLRLVAGIALGSMSLAPSVHGQTPAPLSIDDALAQPSFRPYAPVAFSPNGELVAYTLMYPNRARRATIDARYTPTGIPSTAVGTRARITEVRTGRTLLVGSDSAATWGPSWSPDGRYLAFFSDADGVARLWVRETASGRTRRVSDAIVRAHRATQIPCWTPDSRRVVIPILAGDVLPEARSTMRRPSGDGEPESDSATVTVLRADPKLPYGGQSAAGTSSDSHQSLRADLALVEISTGDVRTLAAGYWPLEYAVAANGEFVVFSSEGSPTFHKRAMVPYDVMVVSLTDSTLAKPHVITAGTAIANYARGVFLSPRGSAVLYSAMDSAGREEIFAAEEPDWRPRPVGMSGLATIADDSLAHSRRLVWWDEGGQAFYVLASHSILAVSMPDGVVRSVAKFPTGYEVFDILGPRAGELARSDSGRSLLVAFRVGATKRTGFAQIDLANGSWHTLWSDDRRLGDRVEFPADVAQNGRVVFRSESAQRPMDLWLAAPDLSWVRQLTHVAPETERVLLGVTRLIEFTTKSGAHAKATLLLPAGYRPGIRYPMVVYPYPMESRSNDLNVYGVTGSGVENMQLLATRGFAVLAPDVPPFDWTIQMRELADNILPAVDRVIELGIADTARLGLMGQSWGGYTTLALIAQTPRFRAAVMRGGIGDHVTMSGTLQTSGYAYGMLLEESWFGGPPWERSEMYHRNSPLYLLDHVRTPLLIVHGEGETTVPIFLADQVFAGLQRLRREVEFARYAHENHAEALWSYANQRDYLERMLGWFDSHLQKDRDVPHASAPELR